MIDLKMRPPLSPVYTKVNHKKKNIKFIDKINIFTIHKAQNKSFAQLLHIYRITQSYDSNYINLDPTSSMILGRITILITLIPQLLTILLCF